MKKSDVLRFDGLMKAAEEANSSQGFRRFYPIRSRDGNNVVFGLYDYKTKKYTLSNPVLDNLSEVCNEIEELLK